MGGSAVATDLDGAFPENPDGHRGIAKLPGEAIAEPAADRGDGGDRDDHDDCRGLV